MYLLKKKILVEVDLHDSNLGCLRANYILFFILLLMDILVIFGLGLLRILLLSIFHWTSSSEHMYSFLFDVYLVEFLSHRVND